jgi:hypothetical protein
MEKIKMTTEIVYDEKVCCICTGILGNCDAIILPCGHKCAHASCFVSSKMKKCPLCRKKVSEETDSENDDETDYIIFHECYEEKGSRFAFSGSDFEEGKKLIKKLGEFEGKKTITYTGVNIEGNFDMIGKRVTSTKFYNLCKTIGRMCKGCGAIVMRQFTEDIDTETGLPIKKLYGWYIKRREMVRLSKEEVERSQNTNSYTGEIMEREKSVIYC